MAGENQLMKTIRVDVREVEDRREMKVVWNDEQAWPAYTIHRPAVERCAREIRRCLHDLVAEGMKGGAASVRRSGPILKDLATQGAELYETLITAAGPCAVRPKEIVEYYRQSQEPISLRFCVSNNIFVPWGLVYPGDPEALPDDPEEVTANTYSSFWCMSRELATVYERLPPDATGRGQDASTLTTVCVVHPDALDTAKKAIKGASETALAEWFLDKHGLKIATAREFKKHWRDAGSETGLLYFYCHANASALALGDDEKVEASELLVTLGKADRPKGRSGCLVLMNGCSTAVGDAASDFLASTSQPGMCGFLGTETEIPDVFALRFSLGLLDLLFREGLTLGEAMQRLYVAHFPMSLLYGLYAHPGFRMPQAQTQGFRPVGMADNLSFDQLGTAKLEAAHGR
jgi:hypothetical protein